LQIKIDGKEKIQKRGLNIDEPLNKSNSLTFCSCNNKAKLD